MRAATGLVQKLAQQESKLKREYERDQRVADKRWERSLESSAASNKAVQHHKTKNEIGKLSTGSVEWGPDARDNGSHGNFRPWKGAGFTQNFRCSVHRGARHKVYECIVTLQFSAYNR